MPPKSRPSSKSTSSASSSRAPKSPSRASVSPAPSDRTPPVDTHVEVIEHSLISILGEWARHRLPRLKLPSLKIPTLSARSVKKPSRRRIAVIAIGVIALISAISYGVYVYRSGDTTESRKELLQTFEKTANITLPEGETPQVYTVVDPKSLPKGEFFEKVIQGDKVIAYPTHGVLYAYRPSTSEYIAHARLQEPTPTPAQAVVTLTPVASASASLLITVTATLTPTITPTRGPSLTPSLTPTPRLPRVSVLNGSGLPGLAYRSAVKLKSLNLPIVVGQVGNSSKTDYTSAVVTYQNAAYKPLAQSIARAFAAPTPQLLIDPALAASDIILIVVKDDVTPTPTPTRAP